jgi:hypothetical protein
MDARRQQQQQWLDLILKINPKSFNLYKLIIIKQDKIAITYYEKEKTITMDSSTFSKIASNLEQIELSNVKH